MSGLVNVVLTYAEAQSFILFADSPLTDLHCSAEIIMRLQQKLAPLAVIRSLSKNRNTAQAGSVAAAGTLNAICYRHLDKLAVSESVNPSPASQRMGLRWLLRGEIGFFEVPLRLFDLATDGRSGGCIHGHQG